MSAGASAPCGSRAQEPEAVVEALGQRGGGERVERAGRKLERERQAVEAVADPRDRRRVRLVEREARRDRAGALDEEAHGLVREQRRTALGRVGIGDRERGDAEDDFSGTRSGSRLVARIVRRGAERSKESDEGGAAPRSGARSCRGRAGARAAQAPRDGVDQGSARKRAQIECLRDGVGD